MDAQGCSCEVGVDGSAKSLVWICALSASRSREQHGGINAFYGGCLEHVAQFSNHKRKYVFCA